MAYNYRSVDYLDDVDENWVEDFVKKNIPAVYYGFTKNLQKILVGEFIKLKDDAIFCGGDKVWLDHKLDFFKEKLQDVQQDKEAEKKKEVIGLGMVMLETLSEMNWKEKQAKRVEHLTCDDSELNKAVEELGFVFTKSEEDLLNSSGGRRKKSTKRRRKRTRKKRKKRTKKRRKKRYKFKRKSKRRKRR